MKRLVYSPKVQAWISGTEGVVDVSPYIVSGMINRKVNQVSSANLVMRNPVNQGTDYTGTLFTDFVRSDGTIGPLFHPMDPIIITMQRLEGHPIQVFTGYLDQSPYLQLFPGTCQVSASCTLKRLLYTNWDASLPFVQDFLEQFGWTPGMSSGGASGTGIMNPTREEDRLKVFAGQIQSQFSDGGIGSLIYALLMYIGGWDDSTIFIEALPQNINTYIVSLFDRIETDVKDSDSSFQSLLTQILGGTNLGGGGGTPNGSVSGSLTVLGQPITSAQRGIAFTLLSAGQTLNAPQAAMEAIIYAGMGESGLGSSPGTYSGTGGSQGILQSAPGDYQGGHDTAGQARAFYTGGKDYQAGGAIVCANRGDAVWQIANEVEANAVWNSSRGDSYAGRWSGGQTQGLAEAAAIVSAFQASQGITNTLGPSNTGLSATTGGTAPLQTGSTNPLTTSTTASVSGTSPGGATGNPTASGGKMTVMQALKETANAINSQNLPYIWGGGHPQAGTPSGGGYDCSGSVAAVLYGAGLYSGPVGTESTLIQSLLASKIISPGLDSNVSTGVNIWDNPGVHIFMQISGNFFGTSDGNDGNHSQSNGGAGWLQDNHPDTSNAAFIPYHINSDKLSKQTTYQYSVSGSSTLPSGTTGSDSATAAAFSTMINLPGIFSSAEAIALTGKRSFIADSPLFPFIEQVCQASLRNFMSMPNGNFFAFFPDYFGLFGRHYYWSISDLEIIDCRIDLSDDPLATHVGISGDVTQFSGTVNVFDELLTAGIFDIFDAFALGYVSGPDSLATADLTLAAGDTSPTKRSKSISNNEALAFLQKYGARTYVEENPAIRSPFYELFYAFMKFMLLWSKQFMTTAEVTFMPELFPGGLVALPDHNLQLYVEEVTHTFDYTQGFQTAVNLSSPAKLNDQSRDNLREGLTRVSSAQYGAPAVDALATLNSKAK